MAEKERSLLSPRYWPSWALIGLLRLTVLLPHSLLRPIGSLVGAIMARLLPRRRHIARRNLELCFPDAGSEEIQAMLAEHFRSLGLGLLEMGLAWWASDKRLKAVTEIEGLQYLRDALRKRNGVILLSAHFTTLEISARLITLFEGIDAMYRSNKNPVLDRTIRQGRQGYMGHVIPRDDVRQMIRSLKANHAIWYAPDQNYGAEQSVFAPFFDIPAATIATTSRFAKLSGAAVVPYFCNRTPSGYRLELQPALDDFPGATVIADAGRINAIIEAQVRKHPAHYLWVHRRFKTRPKGEAPVY